MCYFCANFSGRVQEAIRELDRCTNDRDLILGALLALLYSHKKCQVVGKYIIIISSDVLFNYIIILLDKEAISMLEKRLKENKKQSSEIVS